MEELATITVDVPLKDKMITCEVKERDFGDYIVYDIFTSAIYLFTLSKDGDILFNEPGNSSQQALPDPNEVNEIAGFLREKLTGS